MRDQRVHEETSGTGGPVRARACPAIRSFPIRYLVALAVFSIAWELAHLPLYALAWEATLGEVVYALAHCSAGDVMIGIFAALVARMVSGRAGLVRGWSFPLSTVVLSVAYTVVSERVNLASGAWAYNAWMPIVPGLEVGLSPLLQWVAVPLAAIALARRGATDCPKHG